MTPKQGAFYVGGVLVGTAVLWACWPLPAELSERQRNVITQKIHTEIVAGQLLFNLTELRPPAVAFTVGDPANSAESLCEVRLVSAGSPAWTLRVNERMAAQHWHQFMTETIPHEVAHLLLCQMNQGQDPDYWREHGPTWETIVRQMGAVPVARHSYLE
jgi:hypothetical protein